jgi:hypothetical protein
MWVRWLSVLGLSVLLWTIGCSADDSATADADGGDADGDDVPEVGPTPPEIPWLDAGQPEIAPPVLTPCPAGWREVTDAESGIVSCDPWPEGGPIDCAAVGEAHFPGEPGCARIGSACPAGDWAEDLPTDVTVLYVKAGASAGGDGTATLPFATIADAVAAGRSGTVIALSKGTFDEAVLLPGHMTLWGACVAETLVTCSTASSAAGTVTALGQGATMQNLRVSGARPGIWLGGTVSLDLQGVLVTDAVWFGISVDNGAAVTGHGVVVRGTRPRTSGATEGRGLDVSRAGTVDLTQVAFFDDDEAGVAAYNAGSTVRLTDVAIRGAGTRAVSAQSGGRIEITNGALDGNGQFGVFAIGAETTVVLSGAVIRDIEPSADGATGRGLEAQEGASITAGRCLFDRNGNAAIYATGAGTAITLSDVVARATAGTDVEQSGRGLIVEGGASADAARAVFDRDTSLGISVAGAGSVGRFEDIVVRGTEPWEGVQLGHGLQVNRGARVEIARALFDGNHEIGLYAWGEGTELVAEDIVIRDTHGSGVDGEYGRGLGVADGAHGQVTRGLFERNREVGVGAGLAGAELELLDVQIVDTLERECATDGCVGEGAGFGMGSYCGSHVAATRFRVLHSALCGIQLAPGRDRDDVPCTVGGTMDLHDGEVASGTVCGANLQVEGFDINRLTDNVWYHDNNGLNLDTTEMPVPPAAPPSAAE